MCSFFFIWLAVNFDCFLDDGLPLSGAAFLVVFGVGAATGFFSTGGDLTIGVAGLAAAGAGAGTGA